MFIKDLKEELAKLGVKIIGSYQSDKIEFTLKREQFSCGKKVSAAELAYVIRDYASIVQFVPLVLPNKVEFSCLYRIGDIFVRYLEDYRQGSDEIIGRYDVIVIKCD